MSLPNFLAELVLQERANGSDEVANRLEYLDWSNTDAKELAQEVYDIYEGIIRRVSRRGQKRKVFIGNDDLMVALENLREQVDTIIEKVEVPKVKKPKRKEDRPMIDIVTEEDEALMEILIDLQEEVIDTDLAFTKIRGLMAISKKE